MFSVNLNKFGHIISDKTEAPVKYYIKNNEYIIGFNGYVLQGNSFYNLNDKFLTLTTIEEGLPVKINIYDSLSNIILSETFKNVINFTFSENKRFIAFSDTHNLIIIDLTNMNNSLYPNSLVFTVTDNGEPVYISENDQIFIFGNFYSSDTHISKIIESEGYIYFTSRHSIYKFQNGNLSEIYKTDKVLFEMKKKDGQLFVVIRGETDIGFKFSLYELMDNDTLIFIEETSLTIKSSKLHEGIRTPLDYYNDSSYVKIGNSYAEAQNYSDFPYLHPGVDYLGMDYEEVYAVKDGVVKAIITTGGDPYWRIAVSYNRTMGYLYAHLNQNSIPFIVGDSVTAGNVLGTLFDWPSYDFTHVHFARIQNLTVTWEGIWLTTDDVLSDMTNLIDTIPPVFEKTYNNEFFAFRDSGGNFQNKDSLSGNLEIVSKCYDRANCPWKIDVFGLSYSLSPADDPDSIIFRKHSYLYDMPLDVYTNSEYSTYIYNILYSSYPDCNTVVNYETRDYYHVITNSDGDSLFSDQDIQERFITSDYPDGNYILKVYAEDAQNNISIAEANITIDNIPASIEDGYVANYTSLKNFPNPFNPSTNINFTLKNSGHVKLSVFNVKGELVSNLINKKIEAGLYKIIFDGRNLNSGIYFLSLETGNSKITRSMLLLK